jgi:hypothetical protein
VERAKGGLEQESARPQSFNGCYSIWLPNLNRLNREVHLEVAQMRECPLKIRNERETRDYLVYLIKKEPEKERLKNIDLCDQKTAP